ncbi:hypothetical protein BD626DRAFT_512239 [Schizophyllum amplum]|uniref:Pheromone n=1 Tax=Schizophyllum amplum TaxID=97359 RepID=A0A550C0N1_9AGAR|nr:hypothetical protein BD626DRAFT_512239 [Auriculariopsis ampla]
MDAFLEFPTLVDAPEASSSPSSAPTAAADDEVLSVLFDAEKPGGSLTYAWCVVA